MKVKNILLSMKVGLVLQRVRNIEFFSNFNKDNIPVHPLYFIGSEQWKLIGEYDCRDSKSKGCGFLVLSGESDVSLASEDGLVLVFPRVPG